MAAIIVRYGGVLLNRFGTIGELSRPLPEFRPTATTVSGRNGDVFDGTTVGTRECSFTLTVTQTDTRQLQTLARTLASMLSTSTPKRLTFSDELDSGNNQLVRWAVPVGAFDFDAFLRAGKWTLRFVQYDPYLYGKDRSAVIPAHSTQSINFGGNAPVYPTATATPQSGTYTLSSGGRNVTLQGEFGSGITLNFGEQIVYTSGACSLHTNSRFFSCQGTMPITATAQTTITWAERWL